MYVCMCVYWCFYCTFNVLEMGFCSVEELTGPVLQGLSSVFGDFAASLFLGQFFLGLLIKSLQLLFAFRCSFCFPIGFVCFFLGLLQLQPDAEILPLNIFQLILELSNGVIRAFRRRRRFFPRSTDLNPLKIQASDSNSRFKLHIRTFEIIHTVSRSCFVVSMLDLALSMASFAFLCASLAFSKASRTPFVVLRIISASDLKYRHLERGGKEKEKEKEGRRRRVF